MTKIPRRTPRCPQISFAELTELRRQGVNIIGSPMFSLLAVTAAGEIVPSQYCVATAAAGHLGSARRASARIAGYRQRGAGRLAPAQRERAIWSISINGGPPRSDRDYFLNVSLGWIATMRIPLIDGRDFRAGCFLERLRCFSLVWVSMVCSITPFFNGGGNSALMRVAPKGARARCVTH